MPVIANPSRNKKDKKTGNSGKNITREPKDSRKLARIFRLGFSGNRVMVATPKKRK
jgi:hypothetical protein